MTSTCSFGGTLVPLMRTRSCPWLITHTEVSMAAVFSSPLLFQSSMPSVPVATGVRWSNIGQGNAITGMAGMNIH